MRELIQVESKGQSEPWLLLIYPGFFIVIEQIIKTKSNPYRKFIDSYDSGYPFRKNHALSYSVVIELLVTEGDINADPNP